MAFGHRDWWLVRTSRRQDAGSPERCRQSRGTLRLPMCLRRMRHLGSVRLKRLLARV